MAMAPTTFVADREISHHLRVIWDRWRRRAEPDAEPGPPRVFEDLLEEAPLPALLLDSRNVVLAANRTARDYFGFLPGSIPAGLIELTREGALLAALRAGRPQVEVDLVHSRRTVQASLVPGPAAGDTLLFITDVTELRRLERVRQEFVANLSHELKTPVTSLRLAIESLEGGPQEPDRQRFIRGALAEADHLAAVIENLRRLASLEAGEVRAERSEFVLAEAVDDVVRRLRLERRARVAIDRGLYVQADREMFTQALANLLDNAARFSDGDAEVEVAAERAGGEVVVSVRDHGPGIAPEHWERVFERFYKVDPARPRRAGGTGLGLSITKHLVQAQGGRVWTEAHPDSGQVFRIALPG